jgi:hypothetical protein
VNCIVTSDLIKLLLEPETEPPLKIPAGLNDERNIDGYMPATMPTIKVSRNRFIISVGEKCKERCSEEIKLNSGNIKKEISIAIKEDTHVWRIDSLINCKKMLILPAPFAFLMPISIARSDARATDNVEKLREAIKTIRKARLVKIQTYL